MNQFVQAVKDFFTSVTAWLFARRVGTIPHNAARKVGFTALGALMNVRSSVIPLIALTFVTACGLAPQDGDTAGSSSGGYTWGSAGTGSSSDDTDETTTDTGTTTGDSVTDTSTDTSTDTAAADLTVTAKVWIVPETTWDVSVTTPATTNPVFSMWPVANYSTGDWDGYGTTAVATTSSNAYVYDTVTYVPGEILVISGGWSDGVNPRYFAEANGVVNALEERVVIEFEDGAWQGYVIGGSADECGEAGWTTNGGTGGDVYVFTHPDVVDHHDR